MNNIVAAILADPNIDATFQSGVARVEPAVPTASPRLLAALEAVLPYIDDAADIAQFYPDSAATVECRAAVAEARAALKEARGEA